MWTNANTKYFSNANLFNKTPYIYDASLKGGGSGGGYLKLSRVWGYFVVFKQYIYCSSLRIEGVG